MQPKTISRPPIDLAVANRTDLQTATFALG